MKRTTIKQTWLMCKPETFRDRLRCWFDPRYFKHRTGLGNTVYMMVNYTLGELQEALEQGAKINTYPTWICQPCGKRHGNRPTTGEAATWHIGICGVCGEQAEVTQPRDFGHLRKTWSR